LLFFESADAMMDATIEMIVVPTNA
jgi:hypothetical protein